MRNLCVILYAIALLISSSLCGSTINSAIAGMNFQDLKVGTTAKSKVELVNPSNEPLRILNIELSCTCLRVEKFPESIEPGARGEILLAYDPLRSGSAQLTMLVETNLENDPIFEFQWTGTIADASDPEHFSAEGYLASVEDVRKAVQSRLLFDVRTAEDFALSHISGAINRPLDSLAFVRQDADKVIVIYGSGAEDDPLLRFAAKHSGQASLSPIKVLANGLRGSSYLGLALSGASVRSANPLSVHPKDFKKNQDKWLVIELMAGGPPMPSLPKVAAINSGMSPAEISQIFDSIGSQDSEKKLIVVSSLGEGYDSIENRLPATLGVKPFYLAGGLKAYHTYVANLKAQARSRQVTLASRPDSQSSNVTGIKPCGTCP